MFLFYSSYIYPPPRVANVIQGDPMYPYTQFPPLVIAYITVVRLSQLMN